MILKISCHEPLSADIHQRAPAEFARRAIQSPSQIPKIPLMKNLPGLLASCVGLSVLLNSCVAPYPGYPTPGPGPNQATGAAVGTAGGIVAGAIVGSHSCVPVAGAIIGGVAGGLLGSAVGQAADVHNGYAPYQAYRYPYPPPYGYYPYPRYRYYYPGYPYYGPPPPPPPGYSASHGS
jgi:hypothetical protein